MKLKTKLVISFLILILMPVAMIVMARLQIYRADMTTVAIVMLCASLATLMWAYGTVMRRIGDLKKAANDIKEGRLDIEIGSKNRDEFSELYETFDDMRIKLKENAQEKLDNEAEQKRLISNIAHDLKTPITAIKGYAEGILDGVADTSEKQEAYLKTIVSKATDMNNLINELTLYSQIDTNKIPYNFQHISARAYFDDCAEELKMDLQNQHIKFNYENYVDPSVEMILDPEQMARVINNIISNSVKYMGTEPGVISMRVKEIEENFVQVEIEDNGIGISPRKLPLIFERTYRADESRNSAVHGSGIGLSIAKKIMEDHGGRIWATSREGSGTTMYLVIRQYREVLSE